MKGIAALLVTLGLVGGISACATPPLAQSDGPVVAFYGDSYTLGMGASDPSRRWSTIICEGRGWAEFNPSVNGLGFVNNRPSIGDGDLLSQIIERGPQIVIVTMGLNDNFSYEFAASEIEEQISADFERLSDGLPEARIIVVEPFWYTDERPRSVEVIAGWVADAASEIDADYIAGASHWLEGRPGLMSQDGLHPDDDGYAELAERMDAELAELGL